MSLSLPRRRLLPSATILISQYPTQSILKSTPCFHCQHRTLRLAPLRNLFKRKNSKILTSAELRAARQKSQTEAAAAQKKKRQPPQQGDLAPNSIFTQGEPPSSTLPSTPQDPSNRDPHAMAAALDPMPNARKRWQRKMLIRSIHGRDRLSRTEKIQRSERQHLSKSPLIKTSVKKLYPLARQIAGKPLEEAMVQMRFSKKKAAGDVLKHLVEARDEAVVVRGMGLGKVGEVKREGEGEKMVVVDKKGKRRVVGDRSAMYVDEAWVGRGKYESGSDHRARGQIHRLRLPYTSISVVLKEEATRVRQMEEREAARKRKKAWVPLPDRPITAQRQYQLW